MPYYLTSNPPLEESYKKLPSNALLHQQSLNRDDTCTKEYEIPTINLHGLTSGISQERTKCKEDIAKAASEWGIFHVLDHGISQKLLQVMRREQVRLFSMPFEKKRSWCGLPYGSYRWGTPTATCREQFSWSEVFHVPLSDTGDSCSSEEFKTFRYLSKLSLLGGTRQHMQIHHITRQMQKCQKCQKTNPQVFFTTQKLNAAIFIC